MIFETERLLLRPLALSDAPYIQKNFPHWDVVKYMNKHTIKWPYPPDGAEKFMKNLVMPRVNEGNDWYWGITVKGGANPDEVIGVIHLRRYSESGNRFFWIAPEHQGKGYMTEALAPVNAHAFNDLGFEELVLKNAADNKASHTIKERAGAQLMMAKPADHYIGGSPYQETWLLTRISWEKKLAKNQIKLAPMPKDMVGWRPPYVQPTFKGFPGGLRFPS